MHTRSQRGSSHSDQLLIITDYGGEAPAKRGLAARFRLAPENAEQIWPQPVGLIEGLDDDPGSTRAAMLLAVSGSTRRRAGGQGH